jgi:hypothetical protein
LIVHRTPVRRFGQLGDTHEGKEVAVRDPAHLRGDRDGERKLGDRQPSPREPW